MTKDNVLQECTIDGNVVRLPEGQLDRKLYLEIKKSLEGIGGKWNRSKAGFVFAEDPAVLLGRVQEGENINLKKDFQFFETPNEMADFLIKLAEIPILSSYAFSILEPSAGRGAIIKAIQKEHDQLIVYAFELMEQNRKVLKGINNVMLSATPDFLEYKGSRRFHRIIANPPFTKNQDIDHVKKMYSLLMPACRLVSIMSNHWRESNFKKEIEFKQWFEELQDSGNASIHNILPGEFKQSGTMVGGCIVVIDK